MVTYSFGANILLILVTQILQNLAKSVPRYPGLDFGKSYKICAKVSWHRFCKILHNLCQGILAQISPNLAKSVPRYTGVDFAKSCNICAKLYWHIFCKILQNLCQGILAQILQNLAKSVPSKIFQNLCQGILAQIVQKLAKSLPRYPGTDFENLAKAGQALTGQPRLPQARTD